MHKIKVKVLSQGFKAMHGSTMNYLPNHSSHCLSVQACSENIILYLILKHAHLDFFPSFQGSRHSFFLPEIMHPQPFLPLLHASAKVPSHPECLPFPFSGGAYSTLTITTRRVFGLCKPISSCEIWGHNIPTAQDSFKNQMCSISIIISVIMLDIVLGI